MTGITVHLNLALKYIIDNNGDVKEATRKNVYNNHVEIVHSATPDEAIVFPAIIRTEDGVTKAQVAHPKYDKYNSSAVIVDPTNEEDVIKVLETLALDVLISVAKASFLL